jgi:hypothetical protein
MHNQALRRTSRAADLYFPVIRWLGAEAHAVICWLAVDETDQKQAALLHRLFPEADIMPMQNKSEFHSFRKARWYVPPDGTLWSDE